jgi:signal transduction histidine kinase
VRAGRAEPRSSVTLQVGRFAVVGLLALALVGLGTSIAARRVGQREAISDARNTTVARAQGLGAPVLTDAVADGDPAAVAKVGDVVEHAVLDDSLVRVKLWAPDGTIIYSDQASLIGSRYDLGDDEEQSLARGSIEAEISDLTKPENRYERSFGRLLEVYLPVYTPGGDPLLFEAYYRYDAVSANGSRVWRSFAPITLGSLVLLQLVQVPLAWSLARRLRQRVREREDLLQRTLHASDVERRQIAADLHDGVVQDLAGVAFSLSGAAREVVGTDARSGALLDESAEQVRGSIGSLRSLLVEIYPPNLEREGLESALRDLVAGASARGLDVELDTSRLPADLPPRTGRLLYRGTQEAVRNVIRHAGAASLHVRVAAEGDTAVAQIVDDGRGFDMDDAAARAPHGHLGLRGLEGLVRDAGGTLEVRSAPAAGTTVTVEVPVG